MFKVKKGKSAFESYYRCFLEKDTLTDAEFRRLIIDWLLGMDYYIVDPVSGPQANRIILDEIMHSYPKDQVQDARDKEHVFRGAVCIPKQKE